MVKRRGPGVYQNQKLSISVLKGWFLEFKVVEKAKLLYSITDSCRFL
jgi:hypothetical protein